MWYSQGTITATINSTIINGVGTDFLQGVRVGDGITIQGSTSLHEVMSIASATQMTIRPAYTGATGAGKQYAVAPVLGYDKDLSDAFNQLRLQFGDKLSSLQPWAHAATASAALDALGFSTSGKAVATGDPSAALDALGAAALSGSDFLSMPLVNGSPIVASGATNAGSWVQYADGTMIQYANLVAISGAQTPVTFPKIFFDRCAVFAERNTSLVARRTWAASATATGCIMFSEDDLAGGNADWIAMGVWK